MFSLIAQGPWLPGQVHVTRVASTRPTIAVVERAIDEAWQRAARPGVQLFDGPMCRLESFDASPAALHLSISLTSYRPFVGTNLSNAARFADAYGPAALANPIGASTALTTLDGQLLLGRRGGKVAYYPHRVHPFAGALEPAEADDVFAVVYRELSEELNLDASDLHAVRCLGLAQDDGLRQPELIFAAATHLSRAAVEARLDDAEHVALYALDVTDATALDAALADPVLTPIAAATITMWRHAKAASR